MTGASVRTGRVRVFRTDRGFGIITPDNGWGEVIVQSADVDGGDESVLVAGEPVEYQPTIGRAGQVTAVEVRSLRTARRAQERGQRVP